MKKYILEIVVFICGAAVMILELVGSRLLAPYLGTSIFVWTSLIGIILGSLSLGYWLGGKLSDLKPDYKIFSGIIFEAALWIAGVAFFNEIILILVEKFVRDIRYGAVLASLILFTCPSILLGMVSPYAVRLKIKAVDESGQTVGLLYAISTIGSIAGTFLTGFVLLAYFGTTSILLSLSIFLLLASILAYVPYFFKTKMVFILFFSICALASDSSGAILRGDEFIDVTTPYNRVWIIDEKESNKRIMVLNGAINSAMYLDKDDLFYPYTEFYRLGGHFNLALKRCLMIGGGGYSYPKDFLKENPNTYLDVVEIDPYLTALAKKYFKLPNNSRLTFYHEDGRTFLNRTKNKYDAIFIDAYDDVSIPFQLTTQEAIQKMFEALNEEGIVIINIFSALEGETGMFLQAEYSTFKSIFPQVYLFPVYYLDNRSALQNVMLVALKSSVKPSFISNNPSLNRYLKHLWTEPVKKDLPILTDDFAPTHRYAMKIAPAFLRKKNPLIQKIRFLIQNVVNKKLP